jgi:hypothetical protein
MLKRPYLSLSKLASHIKNNQWRELESLYWQKSLTANDYKRVINSANMDDLLTNSAYGLHGIVIAYHSNWLRSYLEFSHEAEVVTSTKKIIDDHTEFATKYILSLNPYDVGKKEILQMLSCLNKTVQNMHFTPNYEVSEQALLGCLFTQAKKFDLPVSSEWMEIKTTLIPTKTWLEFINPNIAELPIQIGVSK